MNVTAVSILDSGLKISFGKFSEKYPTSFRSLTSNQRRVRDLRNVLLQLDVIRTRHLTRQLSCQKKKKPNRYGQFSCLFFTIYFFCDVTVLSSFPFLVVGSLGCRRGSLFLVSRESRETLASRHPWNRECLSNRYLQ